MPRSFSASSNEEILDPMPSPPVPVLYTGTVLEEGIVWKFSERVVGFFLYNP